MTRRIGPVVIIEEEPEEPCELCGKMDELRPAGPNKERVCFDCAQKDPAAMKRYQQRLFLGGEIQ